MKRFLLLIAVLAVGLAAHAQKQYKVYAVGFYNVENLFDTCHDVGKNDYDFLPEGSYKWNGLKYRKKLHNMARALSEIGTDTGSGKLPLGCAVIGISEVENSKALDDLVAQPELAARGYKYVHIEGPDRRGVDCAMLYNPSLFTVQDVVLVPYVQELEQDSAYYTRGFLTVSGLLDNEPFSIIVCHWPSRASGSFYRESAGRQVKVVKDSILRADPTRKVIVMGDMNDDPHNASMRRELSAKPEIADVKDGDMYNPWWNVLDSGRGTLLYNGSWNLFDQIVMTPNLLDRDNTRDFRTLTYWRCQIQSLPYLVQEEGKYKNAPKRTTASGVWLDGYSDHLPTVVYLIKEKQ